MSNGIEYFLVFTSLQKQSIIYFILFNYFPLEEEVPQNQEILENNVSLKWFEFQEP